MKIFNEVNKIFRKLNLSLFQVCFIVFILVSLTLLSVGMIYGKTLTELFSNSDKKGTLIMFHADWCPHCQKALPEFQKCQKKFEGNPTYNVIEVEQKQSKTDPNWQKHKDLIKGFPTIIFEKTNGEVVPYNGQRTAQDFEEFLKQQ